MSFILDALKKSETERQRADTPALYEVKMAPARQRVATWLIVLAALLVINIVVLSVVLLRGNRSGAPAVEANTPPTPAPAGVSPSAAPVPAASPPVLAPTPALTGLSSAPDTATSAPAVANEDDVPAADPSRRFAGSAGSDQVPSYEQVSAASGANLPELKLDLHAYASNPADRFVFLNGVNLTEGQTSPAGVRVETITPDGAILSWHGTRFFLHSQ